MELKGKITSAREMSGENIKKLEDKYSLLLDKKVLLENEIDESLIGGFKVKIGDMIWDESVFSMLEDIKNKMTPDTLSDIPIPSSKRFHKVSGSVISVGDGIASVSGMKNCKYSELIDFGNGCQGIAMSLMADHIECILLGDENLIRENQPVVGTGKVLEVAVGDEMIGRVVDPLGRPLDELGDIKTDKTRPIEFAAAPIIDRSPVSRPLQTGCLAIDAAIPLGKGQRQLIIGDRQLGKTTLATDAIINQKGKDVVCIYVAIGQKVSDTARLVKQFREAGAMDYTVVVCSTASDSVPMQYIAPYSGCAIGEYFMYSGRDVLIVYDDLSKHAVAYRTISLLMKRPPGREAYPGDVFYLHSRLLERSACLSEKLGGGSMTALPIVETQKGDISAYIPTNVISITDGQIFLQSSSFNAGIRPAINLGLSVSRVGGAAQSKAVRKYSGKLRLELAQYREMEVFARFGSELDMDTQRLLKKGKLFTELLIQSAHKPMEMCDEAILLFVFVTGKVADLEAEKVAHFKRKFITFIHTNYPEVPEEIEKTGELSDKTEEIITAALAEYMTDN